MKATKQILATIALVVGSTMAVPIVGAAEMPITSGTGCSMIASSDDVYMDDEKHVSINDIVPSADTSVMQDSVLAEYIQEQIEVQKEIAAKAEKDRQERLQRESEERAERERLAQIDSITANPDNVTELSNLTEEQFYIMTKGTWWEGNEWILMEIENQYHINAMFAMSVSTLESGCGTTWRAQTKQNYYGAEVPWYFDNLYDSTMYFGDFLNRLYIDEGLISVWAIGPKYCPPNRNWETYMYDYMNKLKNKVVETVR